MFEGGFVSFFRQHWKSIVLLLLGVLIPLLLIADLTEDVFRDGGFVWDRTILDWYRAHRTPTLTALATGLAVVAGLGGLPLMTLGITAGLWRGHRHAQARYFLLSVAGSLLLNLAAKVIFQRPRPDVLNAVMHEPGFSFPSGHAMTNAAFGFALAYVFWRTRWRWPVTVFGVLWALMVGASRNYLGVHYPTDVLVGMLSSLVWVTGLYLVMRRHWPSLENSNQGVLEVSST